MSIVDLDAVEAAAMRARGMRRWQAANVPTGWHHVPANDMLALVRIARAAYAWAEAWDATHGRTFYAGDERGHELIKRRDAAEEALRAAVRGDDG